jgi:dTDP-4-dehydrorhamnose 3,5-epimerase
MSEIQEPMLGVVLRPLARFEDSRGWLSELSVTKPGVARGPHEHVAQTDGFAFISGSYELYLWENRPGQPGQSLVIPVGEANPVLITVPPGVVHAYRNVGAADAFVLNFPDKLYAGWGKKEPVDEIRHESDPNSPFKLP